MRHIFAVIAALIATSAFGQEVVYGPKGYAIIKVPAKTDAKGLVAEPAVEYHTGLLHTKAFNAEKLPLMQLADCGTVPDEFDLRDFGVITETKNQGGCGSCWSFSKTNAFESWLIASGKAKSDASEQELVSNDGNNYGCGGGNIQSASREYQVQKGQGLEADFPYTARDSSSRSITPIAKAPAEGFVEVGGSGSEKIKAAQCALMTYHTSAWITVGADGDWGSPPSGDNDTWSRCSNNGTNHAIGLIGWKTVNGKVYWKVKNSWGKSWGSTAGRPGAEKGYALIPQGCDGLGEEIAFLPAQPAPPPPPPGPTPPGPTPTPVDVPWKWIAVGLGALLLLAGVFFLGRRSK